VGGERTFSNSAGKKGDIVGNFKKLLEWQERNIKRLDRRYQGMGCKKGIAVNGESSFGQELTRLQVKRTGRGGGGSRENLKGKQKREKKGGGKRGFCSAYTL